MKSSVWVSGLPAPEAPPCPSLIELAQGADVLVHEVMHIPSIDPLVRRSNAERLRQQLIDSHTSSTDVDTVASQAGVALLVLTHFVPSNPVVAEETWIEDARTGFGGEIIAGRDLMVI